MRETKKLTVEQLKIGQEFLCYKIGQSTTHPCLCHIKEIGPDGIIIYDKTRPSAGSEKVPINAIFEVELTDKEFNQKYRDSAKEVYDILSGAEYIGDRGSHEMYNGWLGSTCQELYKNLKDEDWKLIGWFWLSNVKHGYFSDCDIGVIAEDNDGERFWCHYTKQEIDYMCECYKEGI